MGATDGRLYKYNGSIDGGGTIACHIRTASRDQGNARKRFHYGDIELDYDSDCQVLQFKAGFDDHSWFSLLATGFEQLIGFRRSVADINEGKGQYAFNIGLDITWTQNDGIPRLNFWETSYLDKPVLTKQRVTDWTDAGYEGPKFFQGFRLRSDTLGVARQVVVHADGSVAHDFAGPNATLNEINHTNERKHDYSFVNPFISHLVRFHPQDENWWRFFEIEWIFEPAPALVKYWETQETTHDLHGFFHHRDCYVPLISSAAATLTITADGSAFTYTVPSTSSAFSKEYLVLQPMKAKQVKYRLEETTAGLRLFQRDCEFRVRQWGKPGPYEIKRPFGDLSRINGARI
jgi:hypothetical protein